MFSFIKNYLTKLLDESRYRWTSKKETFLNLKKVMNCIENQHNENAFWNQATTSLPQSRIN